MSRIGHVVKKCNVFLLKLMLLVLIELHVPIWSVRYRTKLTFAHASFAASRLAISLEMEHLNRCEVVIGC